MRKWKRQPADAGMLKRPWQARADRAASILFWTIAVHLYA